MSEFDTGDYIDLVIGVILFIYAVFITTKIYIDSAIEKGKFKLHYRINAKRDKFGDIIITAVPERTHYYKCYVLRQDGDIHRLGYDHEEVPEEYLLRRKLRYTDLTEEFLVGLVRKNNPECFI